MTFAGTCCITLPAQRCGFPSQSDRGDVLLDRKRHLDRSFGPLDAKKCASPGLICTRNNGAQRARDFPCCMRDGMTLEEMQSSYGVSRPIVKVFGRSRFSCREQLAPDR